MSEPCSEQALFGQVLFSYTRAQALEDGILRDAGPMAADAGFRWPVAITAGAWNDCIAWTPADSVNQVTQDETGRLWDVLSLAARAAKANPDVEGQLLFELYRVPRDGATTFPTPTTLKLIVGPGDHGEPVMTILLPEED